MQLGEVKGDWSFFKGGRGKKKMNRRDREVEGKEAKIGKSVAAAAAAADS